MGQNSLNEQQKHQAIELVAGEYRASIGVIGAAPAGLTWHGRDLLQPLPASGPADPAASDPFSDTAAGSDTPPLSSGIILAPWPNRLADGHFTFHGRSHRLAITEPERNTAIHGLVDSQEWSVARRTVDTVVLTTTVRPAPGWPWPLSLTATWRLADEAHPIRPGLSLILDVHNDAPIECPLGVGWHPYLVAAGARLDDSQLLFDGEFTLELDPVRNLPTGVRLPVDAPFLQVDGGTHAEPARTSTGAMARPLAGQWLDHCFRLAPQAPENGPFVSLATLLGPDGNGVELWGDRSFGWLQIFTADPDHGQGFPGVGRAIAVEPMTCPPNALASGEDVIRVAPGQSRVFSVGVTAVGIGN